MSKNTYRPISNFGSNALSPVNNPLSYCIGTRNMDQRFLHGGSSYVIDGQSSKPCQMFLSEYCAQKWDGFCELASKNTNTNYPNNVQTCGGVSDVACRGMNQGDVLIRNTAARKYLVHMANCSKKYEPFDPTVAASPMISYWKKDDCGGSCIPVYSVNPDTIDHDIVMNKILSKPIIAIDILVNIFNTMKRQGTLDKLKGTKLGKFYKDNVSFFLRN